MSSAHSSNFNSHLKCVGFLLFDHIGMSGNPPVTPPPQIIGFDYIRWIEEASPRSLQNISDLLSESQGTSRQWDALAVEEEVNFGKCFIIEPWRASVELIIEEQQPCKGSRWTGRTRPVL
jgi:hypothetical protein